MTKFTVLLSVLMLPLLIDSCSNGIKEIDVDDVDIVEFDKNDADARIIPIKCPVPIDGVYRCIAYDDYVFIQGLSSHNIYCIQNDTVVGILETTGRGRGEYTTINDFGYSPYEKVLYVSADQKLLKYTVPDFSFVSSVDIAVTSLNMIFLNENEILMNSSFYEENGKDVYRGICLVSVQTGEVLKRCYDFDFVSKKMMLKHDITQVEGGFLFSHNSFVENRIMFYDISAGSTRELFRLKFNADWKVPKRLIKLAKKDKVLYAMEDYKETRHLEGVHYPDITPSGLTFWCFPRENNKARPVSVLVKDDKIIRRTYKISGTDIDPSPHCLKNGYCLEIVSSTDFDDERADELSPFGRELKRIADAQPFDNPVLLYFKVK